MTVADQFDPEVQRVAQQMKAQEQLRADAKAFVTQTAMLIYANLIRETIDLTKVTDLTELRKLANAAKDAAPVLAEAYGIIKIQQRVPDGQQGLERG